MTFRLPKVQVQLGFLIAVCRSEERADFQYNEITQHPGKPIPQPPGKNKFNRLSSNADKYPHLERQCLNRAQWAIEALDDELQGRRHSYSPLRSFQRKPEAKISLKEWTVEFDGHVEENQANQFDWVGVKLTSPKFKNESKDLADLEKQLKKILVILNKKYLTVSNAETRLKVAVYLNRYDATPEQMKAIAALIWIADPLLGDVHPPYCGPNSISSLGLQYSKLIRDKSPLRLKTQLISTVRTGDPWNNHLSPNRRPLELLSHPRELKEAKYLDGVDKILGADSVDSLIDLMNVSIHDAKDYPQASPAYRFELPAKSGDMAIWFNQHCGTLNYAEIDNWIAFCVGVIQLSIGKNGASISDSYPRLRYSSGIFAFLRGNGLREPAAYFERKLQTNKIPDLDQWPIVSEALSFRDEDSLSSLDGFSTTTSSLDSDFTPSSSARNEYSFGIELEMYIPKKRDAPQSPPRGLLIDFSDSADASVCIDPDSKDDRQTGLSSREETVDQIAAVLTENGLLATNTDMHDGDFDQTAWLKMLVEHGLVPIAGIDHKYQTWTVTIDGSLHAFYDWAGYESASGIEAVSPVLQDKATSWENVVNVLSSLRNNFRLLETNNCGFHIHIAKGMETLSIHLLRKLCILMCCVEDVIFRLCHPSRRGNKWALNILGEGSFLYDNYNEGWPHLEVPCDFWQYVPCSMASFPSILGPLKKIWKAKDEKELQMLLNPSGLNFNKSCIFLPKIRSLTGTVEFRHLEGTLDPELIIRWGQLLTALFRFADKAPTEKWEPLLTTVIRSRQSVDLDPNLLRGFLTFLGLEDDYDFWTHRVDTMSKLEGDNNQLSCRPDEDQKVCSRINEGRIASLHKNLCRRERTHPFLKEEKAEEAKGGATESASPVNPSDRAALILEEAGFEKELVERIPAANIEKGSGLQAGPAKDDTPEDDVDKLTSDLLQLLRKSRAQAEKKLERYNDD
ncbi:unnamed protein product [Fusarium equiseti]|uniref:Uncharacterized protein n=1 Tax=Fusarium equiseti TaxID=61235 RepID=A0A8J2IQC1_FUSEQ|nr:unnamed protein product [Fusarium equiseti]